MVVVVMLFVENHIEIKALDGVLHHTSGNDLNAFLAEPFEGFPHHAFVSSEVEQRSDCHVAADPAAAIKI